MLRAVFLAVMADSELEAGIAPLGFFTNRARVKCLTVADFCRIEALFPLDGFPQLGGASEGGDGDPKDVIRVSEDHERQQNRRGNHIQNDHRPSEHAEEADLHRDDHEKQDFDAWE